MIRGVGQLTQDDPEVQAEQPGIEELQLVQVNPSKYVPSGHCAKQKILTTCDVIENMFKAAAHFFRLSVLFFVKKKFSQIFMLTKCHL